VEAKSFETLNRSLILVVNMLVADFSAHR